MQGANNKPMLNAYPDSIGGKLSNIVDFLKREEMKDIFSSFYILPSVFNTDLDRGFSVINYDLSKKYASEEDIKAIQNMGIDLKLDFILNHASVLSEQFQDIIKNGDDSKYKDFFIDWNKFWDGCGEMTPEGYIQPDEKYIKNMFFRKPGLPILMVRFPDGRNVPYWNTFYQEVKYPKLDPQDIMAVSELQYTQAQDVVEIIESALNEQIPLHNIAWGEYESVKDTVIDLMESGRKFPSRFHQINDCVFDRFILAPCNIV